MAKESTTSLALTTETALARNEATAMPSVSSLGENRAVSPETLTLFARQFGGACIEALAYEVQNGSGAARVSAANALLERGFGKARGSLELTGSLVCGHELPDELLNLLDSVYVNLGGR